MAPAFPSEGELVTELWCKEVIDRRALKLLYRRQLPEIRTYSPHFLAEQIFIGDRGK
jgi:hypothetical protein